MTALKPTIPVTRDWIASRTDLYRDLTTAVADVVRENETKTVEETLQTLPEGLRAIWYADQYFRHMEAGGCGEFFRAAVAADPSGRRIVSSYIALNRLGMLQFARLLARGAAVSLDLVGKEAEKELRPLIDDAGLQAPRRSRKPLSAEEFARAAGTVDREFQGLGPIWGAHIERYVRSQPRLFVVDP